MFNYISAKTFSEKKFNEDEYYTSDDFIFVLDGASGLTKLNVMTEDDAYWFVNRLKEEIIRRKGYERIVDIVCESVEAVRDEYKLDFSKMDKREMPAACLSLFRIKDQKLQYFGLGDSVGIIEKVNGEVECYFDENIERLDMVAFLEMKRISEKQDIPFLSARKFVNNILLQNRDFRNKENGFYALDLTLDWLPGFTYKEWDLNEISRVTCMSDGFYQFFSFKREECINKLIDLMELDLSSCFKELYKLQEEDYTCEKILRSRKRDDTTAIIARVFD